MKRLFLDTNVVIDLLADRKPYAHQASRLFTLAQKNHITIYVAAITITNIWYILRKLKSPKEAQKLIEMLLPFVNLVQVDQNTIQQALRLKFNDFEDAVQEVSAQQVPDLFALITRNKSDFKKSACKVFSPNEVLAIID